jgi:subtilisin family serine protease
MRPKRNFSIRTSSPESSKEVIFKIKDDGEAKRSVASLDAKGALESTAPAPDGPLEQVLGELGLISVDPLFLANDLGRRAMSRSESVIEVDSDDAEIAGVNVLRFQTSQQAEEANQRLQADPRLEYSHVVQKRSLCASHSLDPLRNRQWGLTAIELAGAHALVDFKETSNIIVAVIDSGVDSDHPDLKGIFVEEVNFTTGPTKDTKGHGTHVSGIIAALRNNKVGISGVCQSRNLMSLKALSPYSGTGYYNALRHAVDKGAKVINLSLGGFSQDLTEITLIKRALKKGVIVVAAMGNEDTTKPSYPAAIPGVIAVGASTEVDGHASFSNRGAHIHLVAPGVNILSTVPTYPSPDAKTTHYDSWDGTSMATPFVTAAVALLLTERPKATRDQIADALKEGADLVPEQTAHTHFFGHGRLNIKRALEAIRKTPK